MSNTFNAKDIDLDPESLVGILQAHDTLYEQTIELRKNSKEYKENQKILQELRIKYNTLAGRDAFKID